MTVAGALRRARRAVAAALVGAGIVCSRPARVGRPADCEVHTLLGRGHVVLYLLAVKSLLRWWPDVSVVVHDDGTLNAVSRALLRAHVRGVRIVPRRDADLRVPSLLAAHPLATGLRSRNVRLLQLLDYYVLAGHARVLGMDSDVVFLARPHRLVAWARGDEGCVLYSPEKDPKGPHWVPTAYPPGTPFVDDLCCGLFAAPAGAFPDLDLAERRIAEAPEEVREHGRFVTQMLHSLLAAAHPGGVESLGEDYRSGRLRWLPDAPTRVVCHYFSSHGRSSAADNLAFEAALFARALPNPATRLGARVAPPEKPRRRAG